MDKTWWKQVTNAAKLINEISQSVLEGVNVVLDLPEFVPWYDTMEILIIEEIRDSNRILKKILDSEKQPGEIIMNEFCKKNKRDKYRPGIGYPYFLASQGDIVLYDRFVWITGVSQNRYDLWIDFICSYSKELKKNNQIGAVFIIEVSNLNKKNLKKEFQLISFNKWISPFDRYIFNMLASSSIDESLMMKQYLSELVSEIVGNDIELAASCIENKKYRSFLENPHECLQIISEAEFRSNGTKPKCLLSQYEIERQVWNAQIKVIFPIIEEYRRSFIDKYSDQINVCLPMKNNFGEEYKEPIDVEIGSLSFLVSKKRIEISEIDSDKLILFKEARNHLAHLIKLGHEEVELLFENYI